MITQRTEYVCEKCENGRVVIAKEVDLYDDPVVDLPEGWGTGSGDAFLLCPACANQPEPEAKEVKEDE